MELNDRDNLFPYIRNTKDGVDPPNVVLLLNARQLGTKRKCSTQLKQFAELKASVSEMKETHCELPTTARSTFLMSFSKDCSKVASTHGDHNVYVSDVKSGKQLQKLEGHPRTPWCIAFHPSSNDILASGCLSGEVRVWDLHGGSEKWRAEHDQVIASLAFHPFLQVLVIATGSYIYFWDWSQQAPAACCSTNSELERVRFVKFDHYGHRLITGISNSTTSLPSTICEQCNGPQHSHPHHPHHHHHHRNHNHNHNHHRNHNHHHRVSSSSESSRTSRRSIMDRLRNLPDFQNQVVWQSSVANRVDRSLYRNRDRPSGPIRAERPPRPDQPPRLNRADRSPITNRADRSPRSDRADRSHRSDRADRSPRSDRTDRSPRHDRSDRSPTSNRFVRYPRPSRARRTPYTNNRPFSLFFADESDRSPTTTGRDQSVSTSPMSPARTRFLNSVLTETFTEEVRRVLDIWDSEGLHGLMSRTNSAPHLSESSASISNPESPDTIHNRQYFSFSENNESNPGTSAEHQNSSLSDHDYFSESSAQQSRINNEQSNNSEPDVRHNVSDSDFFTSGEFWHTFVRLKSICKDLEERLIRQVSLQRNDDTEPVAGPSLNDGGSGVTDPAELLLATRNENVEPDFPNLYIPIINMLGRIRMALRFSTLSLTAVRDRIDQIRERIRRIIVRLRHWTGGRHIGNAHRDIFEEMTVQLTEQMERLLQADERLANAMALSEQTSASIQTAEQSSLTTEQNLELPSLTLHLPEAISSIPEESELILHQDIEQSSNINVASSSGAVHDTFRSSSILEENRISSTQAQEYSTHHYELLNNASFRRNLSSQYSGNNELGIYSYRYRQNQTSTSEPEVIDITSDTEVTEVSSEPEIMEVSAEAVLTSEVSPTLPVTTEVSSVRANIAASMPMTTEISSVPMTRNYSPRSSYFDLLEDMNDDDLISNTLRGIASPEPIIVPPSSVPVTAESPLSPVASDNLQRSSYFDLLEDMSDDDLISSTLAAEGIEVSPATLTATTSASVTRGPGAALLSRGSLSFDLIEDMSDDDLLTSTMNAALRNRSTRRNDVNSEEVSSPEGSELELFNVSESRIEPSRLSSLIDPSQFEPISDASTDDSDRPITPPLLMYSPTYNSLLFNGNSRSALNDPLTQNHRIQVWDYTSYAIPAIHDSTANIVVRRCMIHNDASVDISQDGEKLVALIPPEDRDPVNNLMFGVFSLKPGDLGKTLCIWGYISNAISVSFSPLAQYVVVGSAYSRPIYSNPEKAAVAQIIKINKNADAYDASYIRSFTQAITNENRFQPVSLNCVKWLPQSGTGMAYATNRGCLCICKPTAGEIFENPDLPVPPANEGVDRGLRLRMFRALMRP